MRRRRRESLYATFFNVSLGRFFVCAALEQKQ